MGIFLPKFWVSEHSDKQGEPLFKHDYLSESAVKFSAYCVIAMIWLASLLLITFSMQG